jgi:hypothetical protein
VGIDFSNRNTQVGLGVAGLVALVAITLVILVFAT